MGRVEDRALALADRLVYARQREWSGHFLIDRFKLRREITNLAVAVAREQNTTLRAEVERLRGERKTLMDGIGAVESMLELEQGLSWHVPADENGEEEADRVELIAEYERAVQIRDSIIITEAQPPPDSAKRRD